jgi:AraC-like DNA-binding protein
MKILRVAANNRKHLFEVRTRRQNFVFPYANADPTPSADDRVAEAFVDPELRREAFTYRLASGAEGSVHIDAVLEYNEDPSYMADLALYRLTQAARARLESSGLSIREVARSLGTSPTQLYRLLDPTNYAKSLRQLMALLNLLGCDVEVEVKERRGRALS